MHLFTTQSAPTFGKKVGQQQVGPRIVASLIVRAYALVFIELRSIWDIDSRGRPKAVRSGIDRRLETVGTS